MDHPYAIGLAHNPEPEDDSQAARDADLLESLVEELQQSDWTIVGIIGDMDVKICAHLLKGLIYGPERDRHHYADLMRHALQPLWEQEALKQLREACSAYDREPF